MPAELGRVSPRHRPRHGQRLGPASHGEVRAIPASTIPMLFEAQVALDPAATALLHDGGVVSYAELNARANRLAHRLIESGAGPEQVVAVALPRSVHLIIALLGVLKAGAVYLPIDPAYPADRIAFMLADAVPAVLISDDTSPVASLPPGCTRIVPEPLASRAEPDLAASNPRDADRRERLLPDHPVYLLYTSGSTGVPKGVLMPGTSLVNLFAWHRAHLPIGPGTRTAQYAALGFDVSMHEVLSTLVHGRVLVIPDEELRRDPTGFVRWMEQHDVGQLFVPTVVLESLCLAADQAGVGLGALRDVLQSGEALRITEPIRAFLRRRPRIRLHNQYGSTEMQDATGYLVAPAELDRLGTAPIGRPLWNVRAYVLDRRLEPVADGEPGELHIAGAGLARGYRGRPGLTAERFLPDPYGPEGERMYRTGDVVRATPQGHLAFVERTDDQVKIRGFRVEIGEVEAVLARRPDLAHLAVVARENLAGHRQLVAYVVPAAGRSVDPDEVRGQVGEALPAHLVPAVVVVLDALPTTPSGKIDRAALPVPAPALGPAVPGAGDAPTPDQQLVRDLLAEALGRPGIGLDDGLFALGGDSIVVMRLVASAARAGLRISTRQVFEHPTARGLAAIAGRSERVTPTRRPLIWLDEDQLERVQRAMPDVEQILPVTAVQQGLLGPAEPGRTGDPYAEQVIVRLGGVLDPARLRAAAEDLVRRHPALRTGFVVAGLPRPVQIVAAARPARWQQVELPDLPAGRLAELAEPELLRGFELEQPPLARFHLIQVGSGSENVLLITYHHLALDGWSVTLLLRELFDLYRRDVEPAHGSSAAEVARWLADQDHVGAVRAWRQALAGVAEPTTLVPGWQAAPFRGVRRLAVELSSRATTALEEAIRGSGLTMNSVVLAAWGALLASLTGDREVVFGTTVAGRPAELPGIEAAVGMFVNTLPVRVGAAEAGSFLELVRAVHRGQVELLAHLHVGLGDLIRELGWTRSFDTLAVFENHALTPTTDLDLPDGLRILDVEQTDSTHYPVVLLATAGPRLRLQVTYRPDLMSEETVTGLAEGLLRLLEDVASRPAGR